MFYLGKNSVLGPRGFLSLQREKRERERSGERKPRVEGDVNLTIMLGLVSINITRSINKQPITTPVS